MGYGIDDNRFTNRNDFQPYKQAEASNGEIVLLPGSIVMASRPNPVTIAQSSVRAVVDRTVDPRASWSKTPNRIHQVESRYIVKFSEWLARLEASQRRRLCQ
jgi:hypothetical protein